MVWASGTCAHNFLKAAFAAASTTFIHGRSQAAQPLVAAKTVPFATWQRCPPGLLGAGHEMQGALRL